MRQMEEENAKLKARMESAERRAELNEQNYNELKSIILSLQGSSPRVGSIDAHTGSPGVGFSVADIGARSVGADIGARSDGACDREESIGAGNGAVIASGAARSLCADKRVVDSSKHQRTTDHPNKQEMAKANGQQLQSLSSGNGVHVKKLDQTGAKKVGQEPQKTGVEVALRLPSSSNIMAYGRLGRTNKNAKGMDGLPLGEFYEVFIDVVVDTQVMLPRPQGQAIKLGAALGRCMAWPFQNVVQRDGSPLNMLKRLTDCCK